MNRGLRAAGRKEMPPQGTPLPSAPKHGEIV
jgi:hypothetical protein